MGTVWVQPHPAPGLGSFSLERQGRVADWTGVRPCFSGFQGNSRSPSRGGPTCASTEGHLLDGCKARDMFNLLGNVKADENVEMSARSHSLNNEVVVDIDETKANEEQASLTSFYDTVTEIKKLLASIKRNLADIQAENEKSKSTTKASDMKGIRERMQTDIEEVGRTAHLAKSKLEGLDKENDRCRKLPGCGPGSSMDRTRTSVTATLRKRLKNTMGEFMTLRQTIQDEYREVVERRVFTVTGERASEDEIEHLIETGESELIFQKAILEQGRGQVQETLAEIQERHAAVRDLERSLLELHQIFLDLAVLVEAQGEMLDNIENQVSKSVDYIQEGNKALQKAKVIQRNTRKWMCFAVIALLVIALIIVLVVVRPWD